MITFRKKPSATGVATIAAVFVLAAAIPFGRAVQATQMAPMVGSAATPAVGQRAPDFSLVAVDGATVRLSGEVARGAVILVVLRGWPGYQCPFCTRQFGEYMTRAADVTATGAHVLFVYPGPADGLKEHAEGLLKSTTIPAAYRVLLESGLHGHPGLRPAMGRADGDRVSVDFPDRQERHRGLRADEPCA